MWQGLRKIASYYWISSIIRAEVVIWGDQNEDGKARSILKRSGTGATGPKPRPFIIIIIIIIIILFLP
jgi:hypothetical protein